MERAEFYRHSLERLIMRRVELGSCHLDDYALEDALDLAHLSPKKAFFFKARSVFPDKLYHVK